MTLSALLTDLARADIHLALVDDRIEADAPSGALTPALVAVGTVPGVWVRGPGPAGGRADGLPGLRPDAPRDGGRAAGQGRTVPPVRVGRVLRHGDSCRRIDPARL